MYTYIRYSLNFATQHRSLIQEGSPLIDLRFAAYSIPKIAGNTDTVPISGADSPTDLTVCVFGDYRSDLYDHIALNLSQFIGDNDCNLNLFIGWCNILKEF